MIEKSSTNNRKEIMNAEGKNEYMLLFRGTDCHKGFSPEEIQQIAGQWMAWFKRLTEEGKAVSGRPLEATGKIVSGKGGRVVADGPFAESKEAIGGYFMLQVHSLDEAVAIAQECPGLAYGGKVEVRPAMEACPHSGKAAPEMQLAELTA
jgi:hypothetical protein